MDRESDSDKLSPDEWLQYHGFKDNPFKSNATQAELDSILSEHKNAFVRVPYYQNIRGKLDDPGYHFIFAQKGGGKTAVRKEIKQYYDDFLGKEDHAQVLVAIYNSFEDLPSNSSEKGNYQQVLFRAHVEQIIAAILFRLFEILEDKRLSAKLKNIKHSKIRKPLKWYLTKYLKLFPWQFEKLQRQVGLRSYLPLFHYVIRVLLGALSTILPATGPLANALGNIPRYDLYSKLEGKYPIIDLLNELLGICNQIGFDGIYILIDDLDTDFPESEKDAKGFQRIAPLLQTHKLYSRDGLITKIFMPQGMEKHYKEEAPHQNRFLAQPVKWTKELIRDVYERRLRICQEFDDPRQSNTYSNSRDQPSLAILCEPGLKDKIDDFMVEFATERGTPRALIELGVRLISEHFYDGDRYADELISEATWKRALNRAEETGGYRKEISSWRF